MPDILDELDAMDAAAAAEQPPAELDRSTLNRYAYCPFQAVAVETGRVLDIGEAAVSGQEAHTAVAAAVQAVVAGEPEAWEVGKVAAQQSREDVQADVLAAVMPSLASVVKYLRLLPVDTYPATLRNPADILRYQGGEGVHSGQLAWDVAGPSGAVVRLTSEVDLLVAGGTVAEMEETDFKSGFKPWTTEAVQHEFQFAFHAVLVFRNYPALETLRVRVWMTRWNKTTRWATFRRDRLDDYEARVLSAVAQREFSLSLPPGEVVTRVIGSRCDLCPVRADCPALAGRNQYTLMEHPLAYAEATILMEKEGAARRKALNKLAQESGGAAALGGGKVWSAPAKAPSKPTGASYGIKAEDVCGEPDEPAERFLPDEPAEETPIV